MKLYLVRHGEAKDEREDPERHLTEKGLRDVKRLAAYVVSEHMNIKVDRIVHSGKTRALETAEVMAEYLHPAIIYFSNFSKK